MSWQAISGALLQYQKANGDLASDYYLAAEAAGTSTDINFATDNTGSTELARAQLNSSGYPINGSSAPFVPFVEEDFKLSLYPTLADAQAKTNAEWTTADLKPIGETGVTNNIFYAENYDTFALAVAAAAGKELVISTNLVVASNITVSNVTLRFVFGGDLDPNTGITITLNTSILAGAYQIFTGLGTIAGDFNGVSPSLWWFGAVGNGTLAGGGADDTAPLNKYYTVCAAAGMPFNLETGAFRYTSQLLWDGEIDVTGKGRGDLAPTIRTALIKDGNFVGIRINTSFGSTYENFTLIGATGNGNGGLEVFLGERINVAKLLIEDMGSYAMTVRAGNLGRYDDLVLKDSGAGLNWDSGSGPAGDSANSCVVTNLEIRGNSASAAFEFTAGDNNIIQATIQDNVNKGFNISGAESQSNSFDLYFENNGATATIGALVTGNEFNVNLGTITDNSNTKTNLIKEGNQAGVHRFSYANLFANRIRIEDRERVGGGDASAWQLSEVGDATTHILTLDSEGSAGPARINITQTAGNLIDLFLQGAARPRSIIPSHSATRTTTDTTPSVGGANTLICTTASGNINDLDDGEVGQTVKILFNGVTPTVVHLAGTMELDGDNNFITTAGSTLTVHMFTDQVWTEVGRMTRA